MRFEMSLQFKAVRGTVRKIMPNKQLFPRTPGMLPSSSQEVKPSKASKQTNLQLSQILEVLILNFLLILVKRNFLNLFQL